MHRSLIGLVLVVGISCAPTFIKRGGELFRYQLNKGQSLNYESSTNIKTTLEIKGKIQATQTKIYLRTNQLVVDADSLLRLSIVIDSTAIVNSVNGQPSPLPNPDVIKGKTWSLTIDRQGKVIAAQGLEDVKLYGESGGDLALQYQKILNFLPERSLKTGDRWQKLDTEEGDTTVCHYTLVGFETKSGMRCAKIKVESAVTEKRTGEQMGGTIRLDMKGTGKGQIYFAVKEGMLVSYEQHFSIEGTSEISGPMLPQPMKFPIYSDQDEMMKLVP
jgi:hypothetical protein